MSKQTILSKLCVESSLHNWLNDETVENLTVFKTYMGVTFNETTDVIVCSCETDRRSVIFLLPLE